MELFVETSAKELVKLNMSKEELSQSIKDSVLKNGFPYKDGSGFCTPEDLTVNVFFKTITNESKVKTNDDMKMLAHLCFGKPLV
jgi:hypothetical protein